MTYQEAIKIGSKCEGYIKCTYAEIHSPSLGKVFSFQRKNIFRRSADLQNINATFSVGSNNPDETFYVIEMPIFKAIGPANDPKWIKVRLTDEACDYVARCWSAKVYDTEVSKLRRWYIVDREYFDEARDFVKYRYYSKDGVYLPGNIWYVPGGKILIGEFNSIGEANKAAQEFGNGKGAKFGHTEDEILSRKSTQTQEERRVARYNELKNNIFEVKECAVNWVPTDIVNVTTIGEDGKPIKLSDAITAAEEKVNKAKAILAIAGSTIII